MNATTFRSKRSLWQFALQCIDVLTPRGRWMLCILGSGLIYAAWLISTVAIVGALWVATVFVATLGLGFWWLAAQPAQPEWLETWWAGVPGIIRWRGWRAFIVLYLIFVSWISFRDQWRPVAEGQYRNDAIAYVHMDADLLARGRNPYTADDAFWEAAARWPLSLATPILGSKRFGTSVRNYPLGPHIATVLQYELANPKHRDDAFDPATVHNYPAGIIWLALPLVYLGVPSVIWLNFLALIILIGMTLAQAPPRLRGTAFIALIANPIMPMFTLFMNYDVVCVVFIIAAWTALRREKTSALLFGLACAVKQLAWFFAPFYIIEVVRRKGWLAGLRSAAIMAVTFLLPNLPFILNAPKAWAQSMLIPMTDSMFPVGYGPVQFMIGGPLPAIPPRFWTAVEIGVWGGLLVYQAMRPRITSDGVFLGPIALWFSWRSPLNYFALLPISTVWLAIQIEKQAPQSRVLEWAEVIPGEVGSDDIHPESSEAALAGIR